MNTNIEGFANKVFKLNERLRNVYFKDILGKEFHTKEKLIDYLQNEEYRFYDYESNFEMHILFCILSDKINLLEEHTSAENKLLMELNKTHTKIYETLSNRLDGIFKFVKFLSDQILQNKKSDAEILIRLEELEKEFIKFN